MHYERFTKTDSGTFILNVIIEHAHRAIKG